MTDNCSQFIPYCISFLWYFEFMCIYIDNTCKNKLAVFFRILGSIFLMWPMEQQEVKVFVRWVASIRGCPVTYRNDRVGTFPVVFILVPREGRSLDVNVSMSVFRNKKLVSYQNRFGAPIYEYFLLARLNCVLESERLVWAGALRIH